MRPFDSFVFYGYGTKATPEFTTMSTRSFPLLLTTSGFRKVLDVYPVPPTAAALAINFRAFSKASSRTLSWDRVNFDSTAVKPDRPSNSDKGTPCAHFHDTVSLSPVTPSPRSVRTPYQMPSPC